MNYLKYAKDFRWEPHPAGHHGVYMKKLRSRTAWEYRESIAFVKIEKGAVVSPHVHENADDSLYILEGRATMRVDRERFEIGPGAQITVPAGVEHEIYDVLDEIVIYDVFAPAIF